MFVSWESKTCGSCGLELPASAFNRAGTGLQHWCRDCFRDDFRRRGEAHLRQVSVARARRVATTRERMAAFLAGHPCVDCGERDMLVLEFDHVGVKRGQISTMVFNVALATLEREIAECEVRCCNCHRRATAERRALAREAGSTVSSGPP